MKVALIIFDRFTDLDLFLPWDILNRVRTVGGVEDWQVHILGTSPSHTSDAGLQIFTTGLIGEAADADAVLFTSGVAVPQLIADPAYLSRFRLDPEKQLIASMCSGALFLAELGLLAGKEATTYPTRKQQLAAYGVQVVDKDFVNLGRIATAAGCLSAEKLSHWIIESLLGRELADRVLRSIQPVGRGL